MKQKRTGGTIWIRRRWGAKFRLIQYTFKEAWRQRLKKRPGAKVLSVVPDYRSSPAARMINRYFIEPILDAIAGEDVLLQDKLDLLFSTQTRDIVMALTTEDVKMPGVLWNPDDNTIRVPLTREASFPRGTPLFIRIDDTMPNRIDIENAEVPDLIFQLTREEYLGILPKLTEITGCNHRLHMKQGS
jgi:hypothetical protein